VKTNRSLTTLNISMHFGVLLLLGACASFQEIGSFFEGEEASRAPASDTTALELELNTPTDPSAPGENVSTLSQNSRLFDDAASRGYRRNVDVWDGGGHSSDGSLWNSEGQDGYFFTRNIHHKVGDFIYVKIEPDVLDIMNVKMLALVPVERSKSVKNVVADEAGKAAATKVGDKVEEIVKNKNIADAVGDAAGQRVISSIEEKPQLLDIEEMSLRVLDILPRGTLRVEGIKRINVRATPVEIKINGVVREEDLSPTMRVASSRLMETKVELSK